MLEILTKIVQRKPFGSHTILLFTSNDAFSDKLIIFIFSS